MCFSITHDFCTTSHNWLIVPDPVEAFVPLFIIMEYTWCYREM